MKLYLSRAFATGMLIALLLACGETGPSSDVSVAYLEGWAQIGRRSLNIHICFWLQDNNEVEAQLTDWELQTLTYGEIHTHTVTMSEAESLYEVDVSGSEDMTIPAGGNVSGEMLAVNLNFLESYPIVNHTVDDFFARFGTEEPRYIKLVAYVKDDNGHEYSVSETSGFSIY